jgi:N-acyl homoserine lactone hydrolase
VRKALAIAALAFCLIGAAPAPAPELKLWRLDCGTIEVADRNAFSDAWTYDGGSRTLTNSCYLIRHGDQYMLWDAGFGTELIGHRRDMGRGMTAGLKEGILAQLARLGVKPEQVGRVGISHFHGDHMGQASSFPTATLMIGKGDWEWLTPKPRDPRLDARPLEPWTSGRAPKELVSWDKDVFGDGSVLMLAMPGHSPDHHSLLVRLKNMGPVLLTGDLYHFAEQREGRVIPPFNTSRAETQASFDRFEAIARNLKATVIIQHDPADVTKLPAFPKAAD